MAEPGTGQVKFFNLRDDYVTIDSARTVSAFLRARFTEICGALRAWKKNADPTVDRCAHLFFDRDLEVSCEPSHVMRKGPSAGITLFLALLRQYLGVRVKEKLAATGAMTLSEEIGMVGDIEVKVRRGKERKRALQLHGFDASSGCMTHQAGALIHVWIM